MAPVEAGIQAARLQRDQAGEPGWRVVRVGGQHDVEGFADHDSVLAGQPVELFVSMVARRYRVKAFRMGWYRDAEARLVWISAWQRGTRQPAARVIGRQHRIDAPWRPSLRVSTTGWPPGDYLLRLDTDRGCCAGSSRWWSAPPRQPARW